MSRPVARVLLAVLVSLALLVLGQGESAHAGPRTSDAALSAAAAAPDADAGAPPVSSMDGPESSVLVRAAGLSAAPGPSAPAVGLTPGSGPLVAPHLLASPQARPPTAPPAARPDGARGSRAPPGPAGT